jgi:hypothetical protein
VGKVQNIILVCKKNAENEHLLRSYPQKHEQAAKIKFQPEASISQIFAYFVTA